MIRSMTGFGRGKDVLGGKEITVEVKSVNHRYFEFSARVPRAYGFLEERAKTRMQSAISRGKVEVSIAVLTVEGNSTDVLINEELVESYVSALRKVGEAHGIPDDLSLSTIAGLPDVFTVRKVEDDEEQIWALVSPVLDTAVERFVGMRETEGQRIKEDLLDKLARIEADVKVVEESSPKRVEEYRERLYQKLKEVLADARIEEQRVLTEAAIFAEKVAVDEETVRLRSHIAQFRQILESSDPVGRKLDFLVQEMNREANTIGSKAQDVTIARTVVEIKSEIEKVREQIQNLE